MVKDQHPQSVKEATGSILPVWIEAFLVLLNLDVRQDVENSDNWDNLAIRKEIFKVWLRALSRTSLISDRTTRL